MYNTENKAFCSILFVSLIIIVPFNYVHAHFDGTNHMHPDSITVTLCPGECFEEDKQVDLEGAPVQGDVFFSFDCNEPMHVHICKENMICKFWLEPVALCKNHGISAKDLNKIKKIISSNKKQIIEAWYEHCG